MTQVLKVANSSLTVDFVAGPYHFEMAGWETETSDEEIWETITLVADTTEANIWAEQVKLDKLKNAAQLYDEKIVRDDPVWFYWQSEGESAKRSMVRDINTQFKSSNVVTPLLGNDYAVLTVLIKHAPFYEASSPTNDSQASVATMGGTWLIGNDAGTTPQRIKDLTLTSTDASVAYVNFWIGIRDLNKGTSAFNPLWEAEDGNNDTDATDGVDANASGGGHVEIDFATVATMTGRVHISLNDVAASNFDDFVGDYLVLGSFKLDTGNEFNIRLEENWFTNEENGGIVVGETFLSETVNQYLDNAFQLVELGRVTIPPQGYRDTWVSTTLLYSYTLSLLAERVTGSGSLYYDCLILIPADHLYSGSFRYGGIGSGLGSMKVFSSPENAYWSVMRNTTGVPVDQPNQMTFENWDYPIGGGIMVVAAQEIDAIKPSGTVDIDINLVPRWKSYRT